LLLFRKSEVCDAEMAEIAFAMAATDDDVDMDMSAMPTFSLGLDLFGDMDVGINKSATTSIITPNRKTNSSSSNNGNKPQNLENKFTKISPRSSFSSNTNNSTKNTLARITKNDNISAIVTKNNGVHKNNNLIPTTFNSASTLTKNANDRIPESRNTLGKNKTVPGSISNDIPDYSQWKNAQSGTSKTSVSIVRPNSASSLNTGQSNDFWSSSTSSVGRSKSVSEVRQTGAKAVPDLKPRVKPRPSSSTSFVSVSIM